MEGVKYEKDSLYDIWYMFMYGGYDVNKRHRRIYSCKCGGKFIKTHPKQKHCPLKYCPYYENNN